jgi:hypothetical protein
MEGASQLDESDSRVGLLSEQRATPSEKVRLSRRESSAIERLEAAHEKVLHLAESIQEHMVSQQERSAVSLEITKRLAESVAPLPGVAQARLEALESIKDDVATQVARTRRVEESLTQLPALADAQRETMASISRQLDVVKDTAGKASDSLDSFQASIKILSETTDRSMSVLRDLYESSALREERVTLLLEQQTRRFTVFACVSIGVAVVVAIMGMISLIS